MRNRKKLEAGLLGLVLALVTAIACMGVHAQTWPSRQVRIIIPFTAGGGVDTVSRILADKLGATTGQSFVVDNRPGAGGNIAMELVAKAGPDGYTLLSGTVTIAINPTLYSKVNYKIEDFVAVTEVGEAPLLLAVNPSLPVRSLADLVKLAKARPGEVHFGSPGTGSGGHLASELFRIMAGLDMIHVPYKGALQALHDVIGGQIEMVISTIPAILPQVRAGRVRALGQTGLKRSPNAPDIPTLDEGGIKGYTVAVWYIIFAPAKTPLPIINRIYAELAKVLKLPDVQERLKAAGVDEIVGAGPKQAAEFVKSEHARWAKVIQATGAKAD